MTEIALFFAGALLCNAIPHLAAGTRGEPFPTPFAKPHGVGLSSPPVNFFWGSLNLAIGVILLSLHPLPDPISLDSGVFAAGFLLIGAYTSYHFGKVRAGQAMRG